MDSGSLVLLGSVMVDGLSSGWVPKVRLCSNVSEIAKLTKSKAKISLTVSPLHIHLF